MKRALRYLILFAAGATVLVSFQNCSSGFEAMEFASSESANPFTSEQQGETPSPPPDQTPVPIDIDPPPTSPLPPPKDGVYQTVPFSAPFAMVYVRIPRVTETMDYTDPDGVLHKNSRNWDNMQSLPETDHRVSGMSGPGQLVYRDRSGVEKILYDCMAPGDCLPMDPTVSFDGKKVIFSVLWGKFENSRSGNQVFPYNSLTQPKEAKLFIIDLASGALTPLPHTPGTFDMGPVFLPDGKIMFTSDRAKELRSGHYFFTPSREHVLQLWISNIDGSQAKRVGPHDRDGVLHPFVMSDGQVLFSTWQLAHLKGNKANNGSTGGAATASNQFWVASVDHTGGKWNSVMGAHGNEYLENGSRRSTKALHFLTETPGGWLCSTDYYRGNNFGSGTVVCWQREDDGIEGRGPSEVNSVYLTFVPRHFMNISTWAHSGDDVSTKVGNLYTGKLRDPMALPGNQLLVTFMKGACSRIQERHTVMKIQDQPIGCDGGIYYTTKIPSLATTDLVKVVDRPEWHEFMGRVAEPYSFVYGKEKPDIPKVDRDPKGRCIIASSSMEAEVEGVGSYNFFSPADCAIQGCKAREIPMSSVKAIRFWEVIPNKDWNIHVQYFRSNTGHTHKLLGDVPLNSDGSFAAEIPCDTPYVMAGVDGDGNTILRDQVPQSLRPGEIRTCTGCHLHSRPGRPMEDSIAAKQLSNPFKVGFENFPTMQKGLLVENTKNVPNIVEFTKDVYPILQRRCVSCHSGTTAAKGLRFDIPGYASYSSSNPESASTWYRIVWDYRQQLVPDRISYSPSNPQNFSLEKPMTSKYIHSAFAIESSFLWKTVNRRLDGRTDASYPRDVDFGPSHPTGATDDEARIIRDWIDSGAWVQMK